MEHLKEIENEDKSNECQSCKIKLDEKEISQDDLQKAKDNKATRIVEVGDNTYKTLHKLNG